MNQSADLSGSGLIVQVIGDGNTVVAGSPHLRLTRFENRRIAEDAGTLEDTALIRAYSRSIPLLGREGVKADLWVWLERERSISVRVMIGRGGRGKTRLALDLCDEAVARDWQAGFVQSREMGRF